MKKINVVLFSLAGLFLSQTSLAQPKYGPAGCGLGSMLFEPNSGVIMQVLAATTNGTSGNQTFGITSGTSNCDAASGGSAQNTKTFVATNRAAVAKDVARGRGETIDSLAELAGCSNSQAVGRSLQKNFSSIFPSSVVSDDEVGDSVIRVLKSDATLSCGNLA